VCQGRRHFVAATAAAGISDVLLHLYSLFHLLTQIFSCSQYSSLIECLNTCWSMHVDALTSRLVCHSSRARDDVCVIALASRPTASDSVGAVTRATGTSFDNRTAPTDFYSLTHFVQSSKMGTVTTD